MQAIDKLPAEGLSRIFILGEGMQRGSRAIGLPVMQTLYFYAESLSSLETHCYWYTRGSVYSSLAVLFREFTLDLLSF
ncbi:hypothetical protein RSAG8_07431, partial [Rhizoctonia solani AG-8 WAC10335]